MFLASFDICLLFVVSAGNSKDSGLQALNLHEKAKHESQDDAALAVLPEWQGLIAVLQATAGPAPASLVLIFRNTPWVITLSRSATTTGPAARPAMILICAKVQEHKLSIPTHVEMDMIVMDFLSPSRRCHRSFCTQRSTRHSCGEHGSGLCQDWWATTQNSGLFLISQKERLQI